jgi:flagellar hook-length control protein FliK
MTIAIVPTLVKSPIRATPAEGAANGAAATPTADISADFASILLGLPVAVGKSVPEQEATASGEAVMAESSVAAGDPALLAPFSPPSLNQPGGSQGAVGQEFEASRQTRPDPLMTATSSRIAREPRQEPLKIEGAAGDRQQQSPSGASAADDQPAKFAVAAFTAPPAERIVPNRPEAGSPTSVLNTLPSAPTPDIPHHLQTALRDPAWASEFGQKLLWFASNGAVSHDIPHHLQTALRDPAWASEFGQKLLWFASNEKQLAQLTLHPPQLGSIEITLNLDKDSAKAHFVSPSADVRGAIETAAPRLREMFASAGIELGQVSVGSESLQQQPGGRQEPSHRPRPLADNAILGIASAGDLPGQSFANRRGQGLIDVFA